MTKRVGKSTRATRQTPKKKLDEATAEAIFSATAPTASEAADNARPFIDEAAHATDTVPPVPVLPAHAAGLVNPMTGLPRRQFPWHEGPFSPQREAGQMSQHYDWQGPPPPQRDPFLFPVKDKVQPRLHAVTSLKELFNVMFEKTHRKMEGIFRTEWMYPWQEHFDLSFYEIYFTTSELMSGRWDVAGKDAFDMLRGWTEDQRQSRFIRWVPVLWRRRFDYDDMWFAVLEDDPLSRPEGKWERGQAFSKKYLGRKDSPYNPEYNSGVFTDAPSSSSDSAYDRVNARHAMLPTDLPTVGYRTGGSTGRGATCNPAGPGCANVDPFLSHDLDIPDELRRASGGGCGGNSCGGRGGNGCG